VNNREDRVNLSLVQSGGEWRYRFSGSAFDGIRVGGGCTAVEFRSDDIPTAVECVRLKAAALVSLGAGNDQFRVGEGFADPLFVHGGIGRDGIRGGLGDDELAGGSDDDFLDEGPGADRLEAGGGFDRIQARDGVTDAIDCGIASVDAVVVDLVDPLELPGCDVIDRSNRLEGPNVKVKTKRAKLDGSTVRVKLRCPTATCIGSATLELAKGGARSPRPTAFRIAGGRSKTIVLRLTRREAARGGRAILTAVERGAHGDKTTVRPIRVLKG
jgi:hemolysin type calcium-binding protein